MFTWDEQVEAAKSAGRAVVALESTVIAHGLPWPINWETAEAMEEAVRAVGATPATIAVWAGAIHIGLPSSTRKALARSENSEESVGKATRRDLAVAVARLQNAATTVSSALWIARRAGIGVFATGGIGGVHREWGDTPDVSADLEELARADGQVVVCSGAKSILDLPATWERLESLGIPVIGFATDEFPAFWTRSSGLPLDSRVEEPEEAAEIIRAHRRLGLPGALLLVQPVPEKVEIPAARAHHAIELALEEARELEIRGKAVTPFLLRAVRQRLGDAAGIANQALLVENARLAGRLAVLLAERSR